MRKISLLIVFVFAGITASAQWSKGSIIATGNLGFMSGGTEMSGGGTTVDMGSASGFNLGVGGGYFIMDNLAVGVNLGYTTASNTTPNFGGGTDDQVVTNNMMTYGVMGRYLLPYGDRFAAFAQLDVLMGSGTITTELGSVSTDVDQSGLTAGVSLGFSYLIHEHIFLDLNYGFLGYQTNTTTNDPGGNNETKLTTNQFGLDASLGTIALGVGVLF